MLLNTALQNILYFTKRQTTYVSET